MTTPAIVEDIFIDIVFTSGEEKVRLKGKEAIDLINFFESMSKTISPCQVLPQLYDGCIGTKALHQPDVIDTLGVQSFGSVPRLYNRQES